MLFHHKSGLIEVKRIVNGIEGTELIDGWGGPIGIESIIAIEHEIDGRCGSGGGGRGERLGGRVGWRRGWGSSGAGGLAGLEHGEASFELSNFLEQEFFRWGLGQYDDCDQGQAHGGTLSVAIEYEPFLWVTTRWR